MGWAVQIQDERGNVIRQLGTHTALDRPWSPEDFDRFPWLTSIDPYGDTTFNFTQLRHVRLELIKLVAEIDDAEAGPELDTLRRWMEEMPDGHLYFKLIGD